MDGMPHDSQAPQLRTLLLTDLCDSTGLVEKLGDGPAAALFRDHDRLVLELQQRWRGRLIDRSDGLLLLFERPLDGLGFALDYRRGLEALGNAHRTDPLLARAGLHVGEVLIWRNSEEAVNAGAKPVEIEGLAKPFTARLMQLARPGQILLSSVVEPLVRRSVRELGERGNELQWRSHGRWLFKGVPEVQEVHEVGEPGLAPLRAPRGDAKARREMPVWRRPVAIAAEVVVVVGLVVGGWFMTRPEPAIAFSERDWVVVGDLRNMTGDPRYDGAIEAALRTSLEQSQFVNVVPDARAQSVLALMKRADSRIDRSTGLGVAQRTGARMLLLPTVSDNGGKVRVDVEVVDPSTSDTVLSLGAGGRGADSAIHSTGDIAESLRARLGENASLIARSSLPLEQVTTPSIEALRAFTLGQRAYALQGIRSKNDPRARLVVEARDGLRGMLHAEKKFTSDSQTPPPVQPRIHAAVAERKNRHPRLHDACRTRADLRGSVFVRHAEPRRRISRIILAPGAQLHTRGFPRNRAPGSSPPELNRPPPIQKLKHVPLVRLIPRDLDRRHRPEIQPLDQR